MRPRLAILAATLAALLLPPLAAAPSAQAAGCPNEAIREAQGVTYLPDCRAIELVNQLDLNDNVVAKTSPLASDGNSILYNIFTGGTPGSTTGGKHPLRATRTASGWVTENVVPPASEQHGQNYFLLGATADLRSLLLGSDDGVSPSEWTWARFPAGGSQEVLHTGPRIDGVTDPGEFLVSEDLSHALGVTSEQLDPSQLSGLPEAFDVFDFGSGAPVLVSAMPGTGEAPHCGISRFGGSTPPGFADSILRHWASSDGSRAFFITAGSNAGCGAPFGLYLRDLEAETTTLISGPPQSGDPNHGVTDFLRAAADGSWAIFATATSLDPADDLDGNSADNDLYRWEASSGESTCLTCLVPNAEVSKPFRGAFSSDGAAAAEDGSRVYFISERELNGEGEAGAHNLYVWRAAGGGQIEYVAPADGVVSSPSDDGELTSDGAVLIFTSRQPGLNALTGRDNGGLLQYYRYDDRDHGLACISCPPSGAASVEVPYQLAASAVAPVPDLHAMSADGNEIFFTTAQALVSEDTDGGSDVYEWHDGTLSLISSGTGEGTFNPSTARVATVSPDGRDVLFLDNAGLADGAVAGPAKLYDARIGGGFAPPPAAAAPCEGQEACHGAPAPQPPPLAAATQEFIGPVNQHPRRRRHHRHRHRRHHRHAKHNHRTHRHG